MATQYAWAAGCRIRKQDADPQRAGELLAQLAAAGGGRVQPRAVVEAARPPHSPLHGIFEWDDTRAADLYRDVQARHVVASVRVIVRDEHNDPQVLRAFVNLTGVDDEDGGLDTRRAYVPIARVMNDVELLRRAVANALADLHAMEQRYAMFQRIAAVVRDAREQLADGEMFTAVADDGPVLPML